MVELYQSKTVHHTMDLSNECAKLRGLRGSRGLEKLRGSWVMGRGTWVTLRGSWVKLRGSWVLFTDNFA